MKEATNMATMTIEQEGLEGIGQQFEAQAGRIMRV
jgi:hypothetical protein